MTNIRSLPTIHNYDFDFQRAVLGTTLNRISLPDAHRERRVLIAADNAGQQAAERGGPARHHGEKQPRGRPTNGGPATASTGALLVRR